MAVVAAVVGIGAMLPKAHVATRRARYKQPAEAIWAAITGAQDWRSDISGYEVLAERDGHRVWRERDKHGQGILFEEVKAEPPHHLEVRIADPSLPFGGGWTYEITQVDGGSYLRVTENGEVYNPIFRFVSRFVMGHAATLEQYLTALGKKFGEQVTLEE